MRSFAYAQMSRLPYLDAEASRARPSVCRQPGRRRCQWKANKPIKIRLITPLDADPRNARMPPVRVQSGVSDICVAPPGFGSKRRSVSPAEPSPARTAGLLGSAKGIEEGGDCENSHDILGSFLPTHPPTHQPANSRRKLEPLILVHDYLEATWPGEARGRPPTSFAGLLAETPLNLYTKMST